MQHGLSVAQATTVVLSRSEEVKRLSSVGSVLARTASASRTVGAAAALARLGEVRRLSNVGSALARTVDASRTVGAAAALARSEEVRRLSSVGSALARTADASRAVGAAAALARSGEVRRLSTVGSAMARTADASRTVGAAAALARSEEVRRLSRIGSVLARTASASRTVDAAAALARLGEVRRLSNVGSALARTADASRAVGAAAALARSGEVRRLSNVGSALARTADASMTVGAAAALARSGEVRRLSSIGSALARTVDASGAVGAAAALARSGEVRRLSSVGSALARTADTSKAFSIPASILRMGGAYRSSIPSVLSARFRTEMGVRSRDRGSNSLYDEFAIRFSRLARSSHVVHTEESFSQPVEEQIDHEPGDVNTAGLIENADERDEAALRAGTNPESIAYSSATYDTVLFNERFRLDFASVTVPQAVESPDPGAAFKPHHWQILSELEQRLRQVVEQQLEELAGSNWIKQRVPQAVRKRWLDRQNEDRAVGRSVYAAIQYADFMDLADVILRRDNWREAFQTIFRDQNDIVVSLHRLHPVRKALAHSRPLGRADVLTLVSEATRIFRALGMRVLH